MPDLIPGLTQATRAKVLSCLELASRAGTPGECAAAVAGVRRLLQSIGAEWDDVLRQPGEGTPRLPPSADWRADLTLCQRHLDLLNDWELNFVTSLIRKRRRFLTEKQREALTRAADKVRRWSAAR